MVTTVLLSIRGQEFRLECDLPPAGLSVLPPCILSECDWALEKRAGLFYSLIASYDITNDITIDKQRDMMCSFRIQQTVDIINFIAKMRQNAKTNY